jgi:hypothetical protein
MAHENDPSSETRSERDARLQAAWDAMSAEERASWIRSVDLKLLAAWQRDADKALATISGSDRPMFHGGPGREREVVSESAIGFYLGFKERTVQAAARIRCGEPPFC